MKLRSAPLVSVLLFSLTGCEAAWRPPETPATSSSSILPLKSLKLYETGVGYFERSGTLSSDGSMTLPVPTGHLDDALKTLVVSGSTATLSGVEFPSSLSRGMARALAGLPASSDEPTTHQVLLASLKGASVEVRTGGKDPETLVARLIEVLQPEKREEPPAGSSKSSEKEKSEPSEPPPKPPGLTLLLMTEDGGFRKLDTNDVVSVKPTDPALVARMTAALDALSVRAAQNRRALRLLATSSKPITLGYLAEAPLWRTSYRLVLEQGADRATLQGWALIHNDTDEGWQGVRVELVNGQPNSFLFPLAAPRYGRRELAEPEVKLATVPQLLDTTVDQMWGDNLEEGVVGHGAGTGTGQGFGYGHGRIGGSHATRAPQVRMGATTVASETLSVGNLAAIVPAEGVEAGALFSYKLASPLDLRAHGSALVPFLASTVTTRRLTWFEQPGQAGQSGVRFVNATRQTLPAGPIAVYEGGGFAGEAGLERLKPTERSFLRFGVDLDVELDQTKSDSKEKTEGVSFKNGTLIEDFVRTTDSVYELKNRSQSLRVVYLTLGIVDNSKVEGADELDYDQDDSKPLAVFRAEPGKKAERKLHILQGLQRQTRIGSLTSKALKDLVAVETLPASDRAILKEASARIEEAEAKDKEQTEAQTSLDEVNEDLKRLREHLQALGDKGGQGAGANPLVKRILEAEDKLTSLRSKLKSLEGVAKDKRKAAEKELEKLKKEPAKLAIPAT